MVANHFGTDANSYSLTSISVGLIIPTGNESPMLSVYSDSAGAPGVLLDSLTLETTTYVPGDFPYYMVAFSSPDFLLSPSTDYWVMLQNTIWKACDRRRRDQSVAYCRGLEVF